jgi:type IV secretion system protein TrbE
VLLTQSLGDVADSEFSHIILDSCMTKILLPNTEARTPQGRELYHKLFDLSDDEIELISNLTPKQDYFYLSPLGRRVFDLKLGPVARKFITAGGKEQIREVQDLVSVWGNDWLRHWDSDGTGHAAESATQDYEHNNGAVTAYARNGASAIR